MVAVNLLASTLTTNNLYYTSISLNIIAVYYNGDFQVIWYAIALAVQCRLSDMQIPLREGWGTRSLVPLK